MSTLSLVLATHYDARIDWEFIRGKEGDWSIGYVPNIKNRRGVIKSGTTILFGFDLGQHDMPELKSLHLSPTLEAKLAPYLKVKGADAVMAPQRRLEGALNSLIALNNSQTGARTGSVGAMPMVGVINRPDKAAKSGQTARQFVAPEGAVFRLELDEKERAELTRAIQKHFYDQLQTNYDAHRRGRKFAELPVGVQTGLLSLSWQTGGIWRLKHRAHSVFAEAQKENWLSVVHQLRALAQGANKSDGARRRDEAELIDADTKLPTTSSSSQKRQVIP